MLHAAFTCCSSSPRVLLGGQVAKSPAIDFRKVPRSARGRCLWRSDPIENAEQLKHTLTLNQSELLSIRRDDHHPHLLSTTCRMNHLSQFLRFYPGYSLCARHPPKNPDRTLQSAGLFLTTNQTLMAPYLEAVARPLLVLVPTVPQVINA